MKTYIATGVIGLAAFSAYFVFTRNAMGPSRDGFDRPELSQTDIKAQLFDTLPTRTVEASEAEVGLAKLGLLEISEDVSWDVRTGRNGNYIFKNLIYKDDDTTMKADHFELSGLRLIEGEQVYFDTLNAEQISSQRDGNMVAIGEFGIKLPETTTIIEGLPISVDTETVSVINFVVSAMEPGALPEYPEVAIESFEIIEEDQVWDIQKSKSYYERTGDNKAQKREVINKTQIDFASITKEEFEDGYKLQLSNLIRDDFTYYGDKKKSQLRTLNVSGLDSEIMDKIGERFDGLGLHSNAGTMFEPLFLSLDMEGFKIESEAEIFRVDQATVRHSDTRGNQFTRRIDVPQIYVAKKTQPVSNQKNERALYSPVHMLLDSWGYEDMTASISSQTSYDKINKSVEEGGARLTLVDAAEFKLAYKINNISNFADVFRGRLDEEKDRGADLPAIEFGQFSMTDRGFFQNMMESLGAKQGLTLEEMKAATKAGFMFSKSIAKTDYQKELVQQAIDAHSAFTDNGGKFQVSLNPQRPIRLNEFFRLGQSIEDASMAQNEEENSEAEAASSEDFITSDSFTDDVTEALQNDAMDNLLREMNFTFEHFVAD